MKMNFQQIKNAIVKFLNSNTNIYFNHFSENSIVCGRKCRPNQIIADPKTSSEQTLKMFLKHSKRNRKSSLILDPLSLQPKWSFWRDYTESIIVIANDSYFRNFTRNMFIHIFKFRTFMEIGIKSSFTTVISTETSGVI